MSNPAFVNGCASRLQEIEGNLLAAIQNGGKPRF